MTASTTYSGTAPFPANGMVGDVKKQAFFSPFGQKTGHEESRHLAVIHTGYGSFARFTFTGKERDTETGFGYFGARYMDHELMTMWLSVDPMADKYPSMSPYAYCAWNPVKLVDPDGRDVWEVDSKGNITRKSDEGGAYKQTVNYANGVTKTYKGKYYQSIISNISIFSKHDGTKGESNAMAEFFLDMSDNSDVEWEMGRKKSGGFLLTTQHEMEHSTTLTDDIASVIHSHPSAEANKISEEGSLGIKHDSKGNKIAVIAPSDASIVGYSKKNIGYFVYMKKSHNVWQITKPQPGGVSLNCLGEKNSSQQILDLLNR